MSAAAPARSAPRPRVGFLFNHDGAHQVAHSLPVALALRRLRPEWEVVLASTHPRLTAEVRRLAGAEAPPVIELPLVSPVKRAAEALLGRAAPVRKLLVYGDHLPFFRGLDALVVSEKTSLALKTRHRLRDLKLVHTRHGAGDRALGFDRASAGFDRVLVSGRKVAERLEREAKVDPARIRVVGYPKFDTAPARPPAAPLFPDDRPVVLYNPHASPRLSSWGRWGRAVLERFAAGGRYNLLVAPHVMMWARPVTVTVAPPAVARPAAVLRGFEAPPHVRVDRGSPACLDMTYTEAADIYLGDVSSQVYEFLRRPRPCVFLNAHGVRWRGSPDYAHWRAGPVVDHLDQLEGALEEAVARHLDRHAPVQRELLAHTFDLGPRPSSERAAEAVAALIEEGEDARA